MTPKHTLDTLWVKFDALEKLLNERRLSDQKALELQAKEYDRRLSELNHASSLAHARDSTFVSRELFDNVIKDITGTHAMAIGELRRLVYIGVGLVVSVQVGLTIWSIVK